jgi:hypothetical protein
VIVIGGTGEAEDGVDRLGEGLAPLLGLLDEERGEGEGDGSFAHPTSARTAARARPNAAAVRCDRLFLSTAPVWRRGDDQSPTRRAWRSFSIRPRQHI